MARPSIASLLGFAGGVCVLLGGLLAFLTAALGAVGSRSLGLLAGPVFTLVAAAVLGFLILFTCRPRLLWWPGRRLFNGVLLIVWGLLAYLFAAASLLGTIGAVLAIVAGVVLPLEGFASGFFGRRHLLRRRWW